MANCSRVAEEDQQYPFSPGEFFSYSGITSWTKKLVKSSIVAPGLSVTVMT